MKALLTLTTIVVVVVGVLLWLHKFVYVFTGILVGGSWWIGLMGLGALSDRLPERWQQDGWRQGVKIVAVFLLAGVCMLIIAHVVERTFHIRILKDSDE